MSFITPPMLDEIQDEGFKRVIRHICAQLDVLAVQHNIDGTHGDITAKSLLVEQNTAQAGARSVLRPFGTDYVELDIDSQIVVNTEGKGIVYIATSAVAANEIFGFRPSGSEVPSDGETILLINAATRRVNIRDETGGVERNRIAMPGGVDRFIRPGESWPFRYDGTALRWRYIGSAFNMGFEDDLLLRLGACPEGYTEQTQFQDHYLIGGTVIQANTTTGVTSVTPTFTGSAVTSGAGGDHDHGGATAAGGDHNHGGSTGNGGDHNHGGSTGNNGDHSHTGTTDAHDHGGFTENANVPTEELLTGTDATFNAVDGDGTHQHEIPSQAGLGFTTSTNGDHNHSISASGEHSHSIGSSGTHTHGITTSGTHTHSVTAAGTISAVPLTPLGRRLVLCLKDA